jgi:hypothetical protein
MLLDLNRYDAADQAISVAINTLIDASVAAEETRGYLGASAVGHPCLRRIQFDWMVDPQHLARTRDIFDRGHYHEARTREHLIRAGFVFAPPERLAFTALGGFLSGHGDGIFLSGPRIDGLVYPSLWEHKAINQKAWQGLNRDGLKKSYPQYAAQVALYQHFLGVDEAPAIFTAVNANTCERLHLLVPFDAEEAQRVIARAEAVITATRAGELLPRFTTDPNHWRCRLCGHRERCWRL